MGDREDKFPGVPHDYAPKSYALSGKIMLSAIVILFAVVILIICLHIYARWYLLRARRRHNLRRRSRRTHFVFSDQTPSATTIVVPSRGINASVLKSLPIFTYSSATHDEVLECPVCLSEFEENEKGRILPKCNHCFHIDCIDMWFHSHSTCPLCRSPVEPETPAPALAPESLTENDSHVSIVISMGDFEESEVGSSSGLCSSCQIKENEIGSSGFASSSASSMGSLGSRRKPLELMGVSIEVPKRTQSFRGLEEELSLGSPSGQGFKSPGSRIRSLRRILSREKKPAISFSSPSSPLPLSCSSVTEIDLEQGEKQESQSQQSSKEK